MAPIPRPIPDRSGRQLTHFDARRAFNHRAFWGLIIGLLAILGPLSIRAAIQTGDPDANPSYFPIETTLLAVIALVLSIIGKSWAEDNDAGGRLPIAAIVVSVIACLFALGAFGATAENA